MALTKSAAVYAAVLLMLVAHARTQSTAKSSCGVDPTPGIRVTGKVPEGWVPVKNVGMLLSLDYSSKDIPDAKQAQPAPSAAECNCICNNVTTCVSYIWLPSSDGTTPGQCWLMSFSKFNTVLQDRYYDLTDPTSTFLVPAGTVFARRVLPAGASWPLCTRLQNEAPDDVFSSTSTKGLIKADIPNMNRFECNQACGQDPHCFGYGWEAADRDGAATCHLYSDYAGLTTGPLLAAPQHSFAATLQQCLEDLPATLGSAINAQPPAVPPVAAPLPSKPTPDYTGRLDGWLSTDNSCKLDASWGVRAVGRIWKGWLAEPKYGGPVNDAQDILLPQAYPNSTASNWFITADWQGNQTATFQECNCRCTQLAKCIGYTWLGADSKECWLHSWVSWWGETDDLMTQSLNAGGGQVPVPRDAVLGRVIKTNDPASAVNKPSWSVCDRVVYDVGVDVAVHTSSLIRYNASFAMFAFECNSRCMADPNCVAYSWENLRAAGLSYCNMYSSVSGGLKKDVKNDTIVYVAPLQPCPGSPADTPNPPGTPPSANGTAPGAGTSAGAVGAVTPSSTSKSSMSTGAIVGIVIGAVAGALVLGLALLWLFMWYHRKHAPAKSAFDNTLLGGKGHGKGETGDNSIWSMGMETVVRHDPMVIPGLAPGEIFTRATAFEYSWATAPLDLALVQAVEAGVNDKELDAMLKTGEHKPEALPPVVELTRSELKKQVQLVHNGLLGRGATALVFQCVWPERFGPNSLLAIKVLKDGHEVDPLVLQSFAYEANVLASCEHPCVVRLYGYCLEPPTVCLILELLPYSLKDLLYGMRTHMDSTTRPLHPSQLPSQLPSLGFPTCSTVGTSTNHSSTLNSAEKNATATVVVIAEDEEVHKEVPPAAEAAGSSQALSEGPHRNLALSLTSSSFASTNFTSYSVSHAGGGSVMPSPGTKPPPLSMLQVLRISAEIAAGLAYLHDRPVYSSASSMGRSLLALDKDAAANLNSQGTKIVHRDLKPANILMNSRGRAKISDFGLARKTQRTTVHTERLGAGTLPYMAPELLAGANSGNAYKLAPTNRVDIYSLSMMMWEMISGTQPWNDKNEVAIMSAVIRNQRPELPIMPKDQQASLAEKVDLDTLPASLRALPEFNSIVRACWNQRELKRPTAAAVFNMLGDLLRKYNYTAPEDLSVTMPTPSRQDEDMQENAA